VKEVVPRDDVEAAEKVLEHEKRLKKMAEIVVIKII